MPGDCVLGIDCDKKASASGERRPPDPLPGLCPGPDAFFDFRAFRICLTSRSTAYSRRYIITTRQLERGEAMML